MNQAMFIVSNLMEESISIQRVKKKVILLGNFVIIEIRLLFAYQDKYVI